MHIASPRAARRAAALALSPAAAAAFVLAAAWGPAAAQENEANPYYFGVSQAVTYDSNVFRSRKGTAENDWYTSTGLLGGFDQPIGRQRVFANANARYNHYFDNGDLNNVSYGLAAGLDWSTINRLSGDVRLSLNRNLATFSTTSTTRQIFAKNVETDGYFRARGQWGLASLFALEGIYTHQLIRYSADEYKQNETDQDAVSLGVKYRPRGSLTLGAAVRHTWGKYPKRFAMFESVGGKVVITGYDSLSYDRNDLDLTTEWIVSGLSTVNARLSFGKQKNHTSGTDDLSITSGAVTWIYRPTGKLTFNTTLIRDTGQESSFSGQASDTAPSITGDTSRISNTASLGVAYAATGKITANGGFRYIHRSLSDVLREGSGHDNIYSYTLGVNYAYSRGLQFACNAARDTRNASNGADAAFLSYSYTASSIGCSAQLTFQQ